MSGLGLIKLLKLLFNAGSRRIRSEIAMEMPHSRRFSECLQCLGAERRFHELRQHDTGEHRLRSIDAKSTDYSNSTTEILPTPKPVTRLNPEEFNPGPARHC